MGRRPSRDDDVFWRHVVIQPGCWDWKGEKSPAGYGMFELREILGSRRRYSAHRFSYELHYGNIPNGAVICHSCDNPKCCNPVHLFAGTQQDNIVDASRKGRLATGDRSPTAKLTDEIVRRIRVEYSPQRGSGCGQRSLAKKYGVSRNAIRDLLYGNTWRHVR